MNEDMAQLVHALRADLSRIEAKMDEVLKLRANLEALVEFIPNPIVRKVVKSKIMS